MLTYLAKYVNILFFDTLGCIWGELDKNLSFRRNPYPFSSLRIRRIRNQFYKQNPYSIPLFQDYQLTRPS